MSIDDKIKEIISDMQIEANDLLYNAKNYVSIKQELDILDKHIQQIKQVILDEIEKKFNANALTRGYTDIWQVALVDIRKLFRKEEG